MAQSAPPYGYDDVTLTPATVSVSDGDEPLLNVSSAHCLIMIFLTNE